MKPVRYSTYARPMCPPPTPESPACHTLPARSATPPWFKRRFTRAAILSGTAVSFGLGLLATRPAHGADVFVPDAAALARTTGLMSRDALALGPAITNRAAWQSVANRPDLRAVLEQAEAERRTPLPELPDDLYLDYSKTGNRRRCETVLFGRRARVSLFALAECVEDRGRYLGPLEEAIRSIARERTWVMPAHDGALDNFQGRRVAIDLAVAMFAWDLATADALLGDRLSAEVRQLIRQELERRVFTPFRRMVAGEQDQYWLLFDHNWNAVCLAGVTGAALTILEDPKDRAWFVLAADRYVRRFLGGFTADGYCSEGVSYWNYGFGHFVLLAEAVRQATGGAVDLLALPEARRPAAYGFQIEIASGVCPAFADCPVDARPDSRLMAYLALRFGVTPPPGTPPITRRGPLPFMLVGWFPSPAPVLATVSGWPEPGALRTWFPDAGVLICRPPAKAGKGLGVAILGGHNAEHHNHNDVGTFMVVVGSQAVLPDIGAEVYTQRTFSGRRYESRALNSYGHAVPVVAGRLQRAGRDAAAQVNRLELEDHQDTLVLDLRAAYDAPTIERLERSFVFARRGRGSLTVTDRFAFSGPELFETALLTFGTFEQIEPRVLRIKDGDASVRVEVTPPEGAQLEVAAEEIREDLTAGRRATRLGLKLTPAIARGELEVRILPEPAE